MSKRTLLIIALILSTATTVCAQQASKVGSAYQIPFATTGNRIDLSVANVGQDKMDVVRVVASEKPDWLLLDTNEIILTQVHSAEDVIASFGFSVERDAPVGKNAVVRFDILSGSEVIGVKEFVLAVAAPTDAALDQNYPNPFSGRTTIGFDVPGDGYVSVAVYDMLGRQVDILIDEPRAPGHYKVQWDGSALASGMYFYVMKTRGSDGEVQLLRNKMVVVR